MQKNPGILIIIAVMVTFVMVSVNAEDAPDAIPVDVPGTNIVFMNLRVPIGNLDLYASRDLIWERLFQAISPGLEEGKPINGSSVKVDLPKYGNPKIFVDDVMIIEVDSTHAALNYSTPEKLALMWAKNLTLALDEWAVINKLMR